MAPSGLVICCLAGMTSLCIVGLKRNYLEASVCCSHKTPRSIDLTEFSDKSCVQIKSDGEGWFV